MHLENETKTAKQGIKVCIYSAIFFLLQAFKSDLYFSVRQLSYMYVISLAVHEMTSALLCLIDLP